MSGGSLRRPNWIFTVPSSSYLGYTVDQINVRDVECVTINGAVPILPIGPQIINFPWTFTAGVASASTATGTIIVTGAGGIGVGGAVWSRGFSAASPDSLRSATISISNANIMDFTAAVAGATYRFGANGIVSVLSPFTVIGNGAPALDVVGDIRTAGILYANSVSIAGALAASAYTVNSPDTLRNATFDITNAGIIGITSLQAGAIYRFGANGYVDIADASTVAGVGHGALEIAGDARAAGIMYSASTTTGGVLARSPDTLRSALYDVTNAGIIGITAQQAGSVYRFGASGIVSVLSPFTVAGDGAPALDVVGDIRTAGILYANSVSLTGTLAADSYTVNSPDMLRSALFDISNAGVVGIAAAQAGAIYRFGTNGYIDVVNASTVAGDGHGAIEIAGDVRTAALLHSRGLRIASADGTRTMTNAVSNAGVISVTPGAPGYVYQFSSQMREEILSTDSIVVTGNPALSVEGDIRTRHTLYIERAAVSTVNIDIDAAANTVVTMVPLLPNARFTFSHPVSVAAPVLAADAVQKSALDLITEPRLTPTVTAVGAVVDLTFTGAYVYARGLFTDLWIMSSGFVATSEDTLTLTVLTLHASGFSPLNTTSTTCRVVNTGTGTIASGIATIAVGGVITIIKQDGDINFNNGSTYTIDAFTLSYVHV